MAGDTIVVGAGAAGLSAAASLAAAGEKVILLEARDRIGGRIHTLLRPAAGLPIELGAEFVHGRPPVLCRLIRETGIKIRQVPDRHHHFYQARLRQRRRFWSMLEKILDKIDERARSQSFSEFIGRCCSSPRLDEARVLATAFVQNFHAAPADRISIRSIARAEDSAEKLDGTRMFRCTDGYLSVMEALQGRCGRRARIYLNSIVTAVDWKPGRVEVRITRDSREGAVVGKRLLLTVPLGVLKAKPGTPGAIHFSPPLDEKREAIAGLEMGIVTKLMLRFSGRFWARKAVRGGRIAPLGFIHAAEGPFPTIWTAAPSREPILTAWAGGPAAQRLNRKSPDAIIELALTALARIFNLSAGDLGRELEQWWYHDWVNDPFARGAYSFVPVGMFDQPGMLARSIKQTLFFAGEATAASGEQGTVHGAIASGRRAAAEILSS